MKLHVESLVDGRFSKSTKGFIILIFLVVPFISSIISMVHVVRFLSLGNTEIVAITLAVTYEIANLTILMAMVLMKKLRAFFVWTCFAVLLCVQIVGNVYYSYDYIVLHITSDPNWLKTFVSFIQHIADFENTDGIIFTLACFLGLPIPMVSLLLVKSVVDYLELGTGGDTEEEVVQEEVKEKIQKEIITEAPIEEERKSEAISFEDTGELVDKAREIIETTEKNQEQLMGQPPGNPGGDPDQPEAEKSSGVINTPEEHNPAHLGVTIRPKDDNNN